MTNQTERKNILTPNGKLTVTLLIGAWFTLGGCSQAVKWDESSRQPASSAETPKRSSRGNPSFYEVFGQRYYVMDSSDGFKERGVASWYGKKFHGRQTSSGVIYDMYAMTAAHKTLPLPTKVRVRNLKNGRSVIVMVNDRGPFIDNRIIDLSYAAATKLDIIREGTALVEIGVITDSVPAVNDAVLATATVTTTAIEDLQTTDTAKQNPQDAQAISISLYLQVGAFGEQANAQQLLDQLHGSGFQNAVIHPNSDGASAIFRVRLGPITDVAEYDELIEKMAALELVDTHLVSDLVNLPDS
jgi:rare lipoprotein A